MGKNENDKKSPLSSRSCAVSLSGAGEDFVNFLWGRESIVVTYQYQFMGQDALQLL